MGFLPRLSASDVAHFDSRLPANGQVISQADPTTQGWSASEVFVGPTFDNQFIEPSSNAGAVPDIMETTGLEHARCGRSSTN